MTQQQIADGLGISQQMVSKLRSMGMPTTSIAAARRWRERNVDPTHHSSRLQGTRSRPTSTTRNLPADPTGYSQPSYGVHSWEGWWPPGSVVGDIDYCVDVINRLGGQVVRYGDVWLAPLKKAMLWAPPLVWEAVDFEPEVWVKLTGDPDVDKSRRCDGFTAAMARRYIAACNLPDALESDYAVNVIQQEKRNAKASPSRTHR